MDFKNDPIAEQVENEMRSLYQKGVRLNQGAEYNKVFEAFYSLIKNKIEVPESLCDNCKDPYDHHDGGKVNCHPQYIQGFNDGVATKREKGKVDTVEGDDEKLDLEHLLEWVALNYKPVTINGNEVIWNGDDAEAWNSTDEVVSDYKEHNPEYFSKATGKVDTGSEGVEEKAVAYVRSLKGYHNFHLENGSSWDSAGLEIYKAYRNGLGNKG